MHTGLRLDLAMTRLHPPQRFRIDRTAEPIWWSARLTPDISPVRSVPADRHALPLSFAPPPRRRTAHPAGARAHPPTFPSVTTTRRRRACLPSPPWSRSFQPGSLLTRRVRPPADDPHQHAPGMGKEDQPTAADVLPERFGSPWLAEVDPSFAAGRRTAAVGSEIRPSAFGPPSRPARARRCLTSPWQGSMADADLLAFR